MDVTFGPDWSDAQRRDILGALPELPVRLADVEDMHRAYAAQSPERTHEKWE